MLSPAIKLALIAAPVVALYSPTVRVPNSPRRGGCPTTRVRRRVQTRDEVGVNRRSRGGVVFARPFH